jgi:hypothetical protein
MAGFKISVFVLVGKNEINQSEKRMYFGLAYQLPYLGSEYSEE